MIKKILAATTLAVSMLMSGSALAIDLNEAFSNLSGSSSMTTAQAPAVYKSAARTSMDLGGVEMRVPRSQVTLLSITPPSLSASCAGISAHFGGISFISGSEIQTLIQHIEQGIPGAVLQLAIKLLCPQCEAVLQAMEKLAQDAAKMAIDSCHTSQALVNFAGKEAGLPSGNSSTNFCAQQQAGSGTDSDSLMAELSSACNSAQSSLGSIATWMNNTDQSMNGIGGGTPAQKFGALGRIGFIGNATWNALGAAGYCPPSSTDGQVVDASNPSCTADELHTKLILMNLLGTEINNPSTTSSSTSSTASTSTSTTGTNPGTTGNSDTNKVYAPNLEIKDVYDMLMCGAPVTASGDGTMYNTRTMREVCDTFWNKRYGSMQLYDCGNQDYGKCLTLSTVTASNLSNPVFSGPGFVYQVTKLLRDAVINVSTNTPWDWSTSENQQLAALVSAAPFPLYQAINAAAVYPAAAADLLDSMGFETAELMVYTLIGDMLSPNARNAGAAQITNKAQISRLYDAMGAIRSDVANREKVLGGQVALQEALSREIVQINQTIQRQTMTDDFLGNTRFATAVAGNNSNTSN